MSGAAFGAIASVLASKAMGDKKGSRSTTVSPRPRDDDQDRFWNDFMDHMYGVTPADRRFDAQHYLENNPDVQRDIEQRVNQYMEQSGENILPGLGVSGPGMTEDEARDFGNRISNDIAMGGSHASPLHNADTSKTRRQLMEDFARQHWEETGQYQGLEASPPQAGDEAAIIKPYKERLAEDIAYRQGVDTDYLGKMRGLTDTFIGNRQRSADNWQDTINQLMATNRGPATSAPVNVSLGDFSTQMTTSTQRRAQGMLNDLANQTLQTRKSLFEDVFGAHGDQAGLKRAIEQSYTPNRAENEYFDFINRLAQMGEDRRYGLGTTTEKASLSPDYIGNMSAGAELGSQIGDWWNSRGGQASSNGGG